MSDQWDDYPVAPPPTPEQEITARALAWSLVRVGSIIVGCTLVGLGGGWWLANATGSTLYVYAGLGLGIVGAALGVWTVVRPQLSG